MQSSYSHNGLAEGGWRELSRCTSFLKVFFLENEEEKVSDLVKKKIGSFSNFAKVSLSY